MKGTIVDFALGADQPLHASDEMDLLAIIEAALDFCLATGNVFVIFDWNGEFCQALLDVDHDMHVESSYGELASHAGFHEPVEGFDWLAGNRLPADWHSRAKMAAGAMTRAFVAAGKMTFPATVVVTIMATGAQRADAPLAESQPEPLTRPTPPTDGARTIGFLFAEDRPVSWFVEGHAPHLGLDPAVASIEDVKNLVQSQLQAEYGPLNRVEDRPATADYVIELHRESLTLRAQLSD